MPFTAVALAAAGATVLPTPVLEDADTECDGVTGNANGVRVGDGGNTPYGTAVAAVLSENGCAAAAGTAPESVGRDCGPGRCGAGGMMGMIMFRGRAGPQPGKVVRTEGATACKGRKRG
jgi:hypothetical protein